MIATPKRASPVPAEGSLAYTLFHAAGILAAVIGGRTLDAALAAQKPSATARPAVMDVCYGTLRNFGRGDFLIRALVAKPLDEPWIRGLLLAAVQRLEAAPDQAHTVVDQAVEVAAVWRGGRFKGFVNGVLRNFQRRRAALLSAADADEVACRRHPGWWIEAIRSAHPQHWESVLEAGNTRPPMTLRVNRRRTDAAAYRQALAAAGIEARGLGDGAMLLARPVPVERLPGFSAGDCSVQDWGAQHAAVLLDVRAGQRVLDACAAPGGKTAHLLECCDGLELLALDADATRARRIAENLVRLHLSATVKAVDCRQVGAWWDGRPFDRILADVPCSASGVVRRHPDAKWLRRVADVSGFAATQAGILDALWPLLAPGGKMLYCTCSVFPEENGEQVAAFVARHPDARRLPTGGSNNELNFLPCADHDGFYYALLAKAAVAA